MIYATRMTVRSEFSNDHKRDGSHISEHIIPALSRKDAERMAHALAGLEPFDGIRTDRKTTVYRAYDVVGVIYSHGQKGSRKMVLSISELEYIADDFRTTPDVLELAAE